LEFYFLRPTMATTTPLPPLSDAQDEYFMRQALKVAKDALDIGEVPVGCVIVMRRQQAAVVPATGAFFLKPVSSSSSSVNVVSVCNDTDGNDKNACDNDDASFVIVAHGANQVNATRDATRHAELVAMDRMFLLLLTTTGDRICWGGPVSSFSDDPLRPSPWSTRNDNDEHGRTTTKKMLVVPDGANSSKGCHNNNNNNNNNGQLYHHHHSVASDLLQYCHLYVTCEPCIMCAAALADLGIGRVVFGCRNEKFGGCGSILHLHNNSNSNDDNNINNNDGSNNTNGSSSGKNDNCGDSSTATTSTSKAGPKTRGLNHGFPIRGGVLQDDAIRLLRLFYHQENTQAPEDKRKRKKINKSSS
jgi:tRNA(Arg) A34 adenosine deaminase TadA